MPSTVPSLRSLFYRFSTSDLISVSHYAFLEALVNAVESEDTELAEPKFEDTIESWAVRYDEVVRLLAENDATIRKLRARNKHLSGELNRLAGLLDAYADCPSCDDARQLVYNLRKELAKAKAETERVRTRLKLERDEAKLVIAGFRKRAELGDLVLGMAIDTKIRHHHPSVYRDPIFTAYRWDNRLMTFVNVTWSPDPAKVLAAIQEVGDDRNPC